MKHTKQTALTLALGSAIAATLGAPAASAGDSPFASQPLAKGYMVAAADEKPAAKDAEGKCGDMKDPKAAKSGEGKCGDMKSDKAKADDGKCGGMKKMDG